MSLNLNELYKRKLTNMDWDFFYDQSIVYRSKYEELLEELQCLQREVDEDGLIWNQYASSNFEI